MSERDALAILDVFAAKGVDVCLGGGWAVDALVGRQTREHNDLDIWLPVDTFERSIEALTELGIDRLLPWGDEHPWNFVLHDGALRRADLHAYEVASDGSLHYGGFEQGTSFPAAALGGTGRIGGRAVRCEAAEWSIRWHTGYAPRVKDKHDVQLLCRHFNLPAPLGFDVQ